VEEEKNISKRRSCRLVEKNKDDQRKKTSDSRSRRPVKEERRPAKKRRNAEDKESSPARVKSC
jgi:hypothetical protein